MILSGPTRPLRRAMAAALLLAFLPLATAGCFGRFQLVRTVYKFNKQVSSDKWIQWFVFLVLNIVPIYSLAGWIDALLANSIEFWTGDNPITASAERTRTFAGPDGGVATLTLREDGALDVVLVRAGGATERFTLVREADGVAAFSAQGSLLARVAEVAGAPALVDGALAPAR